MTRSEKQYWKQERAKGYNRYILSSIYRNGLPFGTWMTLGAMLFSVLTHYPIDSPRKLLSKFGVSTLVFGYGIGRGEWRSKELDFKKPTEADAIN